MCASWQHGGHHLGGVAPRYSIGPTVLQWKVTHEETRLMQLAECRAETTKRTSALTFNAADEADEEPTRIMAEAEGSVPHVTCGTNYFSFRNGGQPRIRPPTVTHETPQQLPSSKHERHGPAHEMGRAVITTRQQL